MVLAAVTAGGCDLGGDDPERPAAKPKPKPVGSLYLRATTEDLIGGRRTSVSGFLTAAPGGPGGKEVRLYADPWPYGRFRQIGARRTRRSGNFRFRVRPRRNTRFRVEFGNPPARSSTLTVYAAPRGRIQTQNLGTTRARVRFVFTGPRDMRASRSRVYFYFGETGAKRLRRLGSARLRTEAPGRVAATYVATLPPRSGFVAACMTGAVARGFGRRIPGASCGRSEPRRAFPRQD